MASPALLGPPEIHTITTSTSATQPATTTNGATTPPINRAILYRRRPMTLMDLTENNSATYLSSGKLLPGRRDLYHFRNPANNTAKEWETDYRVIQRKFNQKGYKKVPEIVFWNLRNSRATPVPSNQEGVAVVSGFSKNLLKVFLEEGGIFSPEAVMLQSIAGEEYQKLQVFD